jgi:chaperone modulatory protein CbpM
VEGVGGAGGVDGAGGAGGAGGAIVFRRVVIARLMLICELSSTFDLGDEALGAMLTPLDQLHAARRDPRAIAAALEDERPEIAARLGAALARAAAPPEG